MKTGDAYFLSVDVDFLSFGPVTVYFRTQKPHSDDIRPQAPILALEAVLGQSTGPKSGLKVLAAISA
jgi:hypothetical protein